MNILPKKRWHVRTKQNIERVRRDEAKAAEEERELKRRICLAEQEARIDLLRKRAKTESPLQKSDSKNITNGHINFFNELEESGVYKGIFNKDHEEEERALKEKFEKDVGILTCLGQSSLEAKGVTPWYLKSASDLVSSSDGQTDASGAKQKSRIDPLNKMKRFLALKEKISAGKVFLYEKEKESCKSNCNKEQPQKLSKMEELRAKRLKREAEEKKKSKFFLENLRKESAESEVIVLDDRVRKYNTQFNPHIARNNLHVTEY